MPITIRHSTSTAHKAPPFAPKRMGNSPSVVSRLLGQVDALHSKAKGSEGACGSVSASLMGADREKLFVRVAHRARSHK